LDAEVTALAKDKALRHGAAATLTGWHADYETGAVDLDFSSTPQGLAMKDIKALVPHGRVNEIEDVPSQRTTREVDFSPWYGGDVMTDNTAGHNCTGGFNLVAFGTQYVSTAAHCSGGTSSVGGSRKIYNASTVVGTVSQRYFTDGGNFDTELIAAPSLGIVYAFSESLRNVTAAATTDPVNALICFDGARTDEICGVKITDSSSCKTFSDGIATCRLVTATRSFVNVCVGGDSGGPVETVLSGGDSEARGEIIGGTNENQTCYYTPIRLLTNLYGGEVHEIH
jgi:hypothetical protein